MGKWCNYLFILQIINNLRLVTFVYYFNEFPQDTILAIAWKQNKMEIQKKHVKSFGTGEIGFQLISLILQSTEIRFFLLFLLLKMDLFSNSISWLWYFIPLFLHTPLSTFLHSFPFCLSLENKQTCKE